MKKLKKLSPTYISRERHAYIVNNSWNVTILSYFFKQIMLGLSVDNESLESASV